ncbi:MAG TPA: hypothetical protein VM032_14095 [Vicinamibacterales bacterium]|nr:hypothetical protein [Vicinamibacterales bacterium]
MKRLLSTVPFLLVLVASATPLHAQSSSGHGPDNPPLARTASLAGPRFGFTFLNDAIVARLKEEEGITLKNGISQFGWQFERQFYSKVGGPTVLNEWVLLVGGLDQGVVVPSASWLVGLRTRDGAEFGLGPNVTPAGVALAFAAGVSFRAGVLNIPMNFAVVPSREGVRVSMLTGFTLRR